MPTGPIPGGVKTGELVRTSQSQDGVWRKLKVSFTTEKSHQWRLAEQLCRERGEDGKWAFFSCMYGSKINLSLSTKCTPTYWAKNKACTEEIHCQWQWIKKKNIKKTNKSKLVLISYAHNVCPRSTQRVSTLHTHTLEVLQSWLTKLTSTWKFLFHFCAKP